MTCLENVESVAGRRGCEGAIGWWIAPVGIRPMEFARKRMRWWMGRTMSYGSCEHGGGFRLDQGVWKSP